MEDQILCFISVVWVRAPATFLFYILWNYFVFMISKFLLFSSKQIFSNVSSFFDVLKCIFINLIGYKCFTNKTVGVSPLSLWIILYCLIIWKSIMKLLFSRIRTILNSSKKDLQRYWPSRMLYESMNSH